MSEEITKDTETTEVVEKTVPYDRFKAVNEERNTYKASLAERDNQITALNEKLKAFEGYIPPSELEKVKTETEKSYSEKMEALTIQSKLETKLATEGLDAEFAEFVMSKADTTGMKLKDGKVIGLDDVVNGLKEQYPKMFGAKQIKPVGVPAARAGGGIPNGNEAVISVADAMKELYPGISEEEIQNTLKRIQEQRGLGNTLTNSEVI